jgi:hypothetical protein
MIIVLALTAIVIENLESESEDAEVQVATLNMSREEFNESPVPGKTSRPSIIDLAEAVYKPGLNCPPSNKFKLKQDLLSYSFSKYIVRYLFRTDDQLLPRCTTGWPIAY